MLEMYSEKIVQQKTVQSKKKTHHQISQEIRENRTENYCNVQKRTTECFPHKSFSSHLKGKLLYYPWSHL